MSFSSKGDKQKTVSQVEYPGFIQRPATQLIPQLMGQAGQFQLPPEAAAQLSGTLSGDYLSGGPGFNAAVDAATRRILPQVISAFGGRAGNSLSIPTAAQAIGDSFAGLFNAERQRQIQALPVAFQEAQQPFGQQLGLLQALLSAPAGGTQTATSTPGALSTIGAGLGTFGSLFGFGGPFGAGGFFG